MSSVFSVSGETSDKWLQDYYFTSVIPINEYKLRN